MSERGKITLEQMQDECKRNDANACGGCKCRDVCWTSNFNLHSKPKNWNLTDPPRFNEAQMALLKALYGIGVKKITRDGKASFHATRDEDAGDKFLGVIEMGENETLNLAELLGKDAT